MTFFNVEFFIQCKYLDECFDLNIDTINNILDTFNDSEVKKKIKK